MNQAMQALRTLQKELYGYNYAIALIDTDEATVAPTEGTEGRGTALEILSAEVYRRIAGEELPRLLAEAEAGELTEQQAAEVRELRRANAQYSKVPAQEYTAAKRLFNQSRAAWFKAKAANDFSIFAPYLQQCVEVRRRWAGYFAPEKDVYDTWLDEYQPGLTMAECDRFFAALRSAIVPLLHRIQTEGQAPKADFLLGDWPLDKQQQLSDYVMQVMGLTREHCVLGEAEHPFTQQLYDEDVRITTHYHREDMTSSLYSVIHEGGHALYERGVSPRLRYTVLAEGNCIGIHESQSRLFENFVGRSRGFVQFLWPKLRELFPRQLEGVSGEEFYRAVNRVEPGLIRTEADEVCYALHVMVRYELEKLLLHGELEVKDLPAAWNRLYKEYLGVEVPDDARGVLQDIHWSQGDFGYFPGYALGTAYAAQMVQQMQHQFDFDSCCAAGDLQPICDYLTQHLWQYGKEKTADELIAANCGGSFDPMVFTRYLEEKYSEIYRL
ncbi:MAG: carboxypeptidase M32 [Faecalibacterium sp.]|nr:carboxypeptidase M32 [Faecalibacterium sp.]